MQQRRALAGLAEAQGQFPDKRETGKWLPMALHPPCSCACQPARKEPKHDSVFLEGSSPQVWEELGQLT